LATNPPEFSRFEHIYRLASKTADEGLPLAITTSRSADFHGQDLVGRWAKGQRTSAASHAATLIFTWVYTIELADQLHGPASG